MHTRKSQRETPDIVTASDDYATRFAGRAGAYFLAMQTQAIRSVMQDIRSASVLDVGGGHGQLIPVLLGQGLAITVVGSEASCHERVLKRHPGVSCITGDLLNLPCADQSFDFIVSVRLISHIENWPKLIAEFCRVARRGIIIDYPSLVSPNILTPLLFPLKKNMEGNTRTYISFFERELVREFTRHGFRKTASRSQFFMPMFIHRKLQGAPFLQTLEKLAKIFRFTRFFGSPVILRMDRERHE